MTRETEPDVFKWSYDRRIPWQEYNAAAKGSIKKGQARLNPAESIVEVAGLFTGKSMEETLAVVEQSVAIADRSGKPGAL